MKPKLRPEKLSGQSRVPHRELIELLHQKAPMIFTEDKIDPDKLKQYLGENVNVDSERYGLNWAGRSNCFRHIQEPTTATLKPAKEESVDFDNTENIFIEGENLQVLKVLQKSYYGKIKMIYIDPPYNTGNDSFIYPDRFQESKEDYLQRVGDKDEEGNLINEGMFRKNSRDNGHYHSNWLSMMYPRLFLARNLLRQDGVILVSIDDNEIYNLRMIMNEVFGEDNLVAQFTVINNLKGRNDKKNVATAHEYLLVYAKHDFLSYGLPLTEEQKKEYKYIDEKGNKYALRDLRKRGRPDKREDRPNMFFPIYYNSISKKCSLHKSSAKDIEILPKRGDGSDGRWRWGYERVGANVGILHPKFSEAKQRWDIDHRVYLNARNVEEEEDYFEEDEVESIDERTSKPKSFLIGGDISTDVGRRNLKSILPEVEFDYPKAVELLKKLIFYSSKGDDIILDFFGGSGTTAQALLELNQEDKTNRKFLIVQMPEPYTNHVNKVKYKTIADIAKERIRRTGCKISESRKEELALEAKCDTGFKVFKLGESNFKIWQTDILIEEDLVEQMNIFIDNLKSGVSQENILYELILKTGLDLNVKIEKKKTRNKKYFSLDSGKLIICLEEEIDQGLVDTILKDKPEKIILLDKSFKGNDQLKTNTLLQMESSRIDFKVI